MILFLTYHRVLGGSESEAEFYNIRAEQLERQIDMVRQNGFCIRPPQECLAHKVAAERSCLLSFDDATVDHSEIVAPLLARHDCRALFFVPTAKLNRPGYLIEDHVRQLSRAGHTVGSHSHEHSRLDRLPEEDIRVQMELSQRTLGEILGTAPAFFAPPGGFITPLIRTLALESGLKAIRTMRWGYNRQPDLTMLECVPVNRFISEHEFGRILRGRNMRLAYAAKQVTKKLVPEGVYGPLRTFVFGLTGRK